MLAAETAVGDALVLVGAGVDPHEASNTIAVLDGDEVLLDCRFPNTRAGVAAMVNAVVAWPERRCAVEGPEGWVITSLSGWWPPMRSWSMSRRSWRPGVRIDSTGHGHKTDRNDAISIARAAVYARHLPPVTRDDD